MTIRRQTIAEEIANAVSHGVGALAAVVALVVMVVYAALYGDAWQVVSVSIFGGSLVLLYLASTLYHSIQHPRVKRVLRVIDHSSVFILIAGTYTPITLIGLRGGWGWTLFGLIWSLTVVGIALKLACFDRFHRLSIVFYLLMGWVAIAAIKPIIERVPTGALMWIAAGGLAYTLGVIFYKQERLRFAHTIWHLFVIAGSAMHFVAVFGYLVPSA
jgi:hemolysin III